MRFILITSAVFSCVFASFVQAQLSFEQPSLEKQVEPGTKEVIVEYPFENKTAEDVSIVSYDAPCSCMKAEVHPVDFGKGPIPPGGKGFIRTTFSIGNFSGKVSKSIGLFYSKKAAADQMLDLEVDIPILFEIAPKTLRWVIGESLESKKFKIRVNHDKPIKIEKISSTNAVFSFEMKPITDGWEYEVSVTPKEGSPGFGILRFETDCDIPGYKKFQSFMVMRRPN